jgi:hypothetical protein
LAGEKPELGDKPKIAISTRILTWTALVLNLRLHNKKLVAVDLGCGMAPYAH